MPAASTRPRRGTNTCGNLQFIAGFPSGADVSFAYFDRPGGVATLKVGSAGGYCVNGDTIHFLPVASAPVMDGGTPPVLVDIVAVNGSSGALP